MLKNSTLSRNMIWSWVFNLALPIGVFLALISHTSLDHAQAAFLAVTTWAICAWILGTLNEIAVGILLPGLYVLCCSGITLQTVYDPWRSDVWIISVGGFILGKTIASTGLGRRIALFSVEKMGGTFAGALFGMTLAAIIISPLIPSIMGKAAIFCGIAISLCDTLSFQKKSRQASAILLGTAIAVGSTKLGYLTGGGDLVMGMEILDSLTHARTSWLEYALWNLPPSLLYTFVSLCLVLLVLREKSPSNAMKGLVEESWHLEGPMNGQQKKALWLLLLTVLLLATDKYHGIDPGIVLILISALAFVPGINLMNAQLLASINFAPLFFIMGCMSIGAVSHELKVTEWLASLVLPIFSHAGEIMTSGCAYLAGAGLNFILTPLAVTSTMTAPLVELGLDTGIDPKIIFFSLQYGLDNIIFPYEYALYLYFFSFGYIRLRDMILVMGLRMIVSFFFVIGIALPWWQYLQK